jgi:16S rRNA (guanine527-N7)-methyltransferase
VGDPDREESSAAQALAGFGVSRETIDCLAHYADLLRRWNASVNLVAPASLHRVWHRHIVDSAQLWPLAPRPSRLWLDVGSGGGLPGVVCALLARDVSPETRFVLVESDRRKAAFLSTCQREFALDIDIRSARVEALAPLGADVISARALAPLSTLFDRLIRQVTPGATLLLPKGARHAAEIAEARAHWRFTAELHPSITDPAARILRCHLQGRI